MIIDNIEQYQKQKFDFVIIGSGPAGLTLALNLEKQKFKIALVEAGDRYFSEESQNYYKGEKNFEFPRKTDESRLSMFGGTMGHWGGTCRPLDSYDFYKWPFKKDELNIYLEDATKFLEIKNSFREEYINQNLKLIEFQVSKVQYGEKYFNKIKNSKFITLFLNSPVINLNGKNFKTEKAKIFSKERKKTYELSGKVFVLSSGGIENSRILLNLDNSNKKLHYSNLPIGNYWYEHPFKELGNGFVKKTNLKKNLNTSLNHFVNMFNAGNESDAYSFAPTENFINNNSILNSCCWLVTHQRSNNNYKNIIKNLLCISPNLSQDVLNMFNKKISCGATIYSSWEQEPEYQNRITLSKKKDQFNNFLPKIIYKKSELVRKTASNVFEEIGHYLIENDLGRLAGYEFLFDENKTYLSDAGWHHMGGTIMGINDKSSVVDKNLKVHGSKNLFIAGSSVFPTGGHANPTLTIVELSLRLGNYLSKNFLTFEI